MAKSKEERIAALEAQIQKLKAQSATPKVIKLSKVSAGITTAVSAIEDAAKLNEVSVSEIIKAVARIKRTGLKFEDSVRKSKE
jgi:transposase